MLNSPIGTMTEGHYVAVIRETEHGDSWIYVNDDDVHQAFTTSGLNDTDVNKALGLPGDPYAFVYKRVNLTPLDTLLRIQADPLPPTVDPEPPSQSTVDSEPPPPPTLPQSLPPILKWINNNITSMQTAVTDSFCILTLDFVFLRLPRKPLLPRTRQPRKNKKKSVNNKKNRSPWRSRLDD